MSIPSRQMPGAIGAGAASAGGQREEAVAREKVKILLVDDNPDNLVSIEAALEALNEEIVSARSGTEALRYLLESDFAAILLDVKMPDMDGFETAELIRSRKRSQHTPILFLTAYRNEEHLFRGTTLAQSISCSNLSCRKYFAPKWLFSWSSAAARSASAGKRKFWPRRS